MKIFSRITTIILSLSILFTTTCKKEGDEVAVKIDGDKITVNEFYRYYYTQNKIFLNMDKKEIDKLADDPSIENHPYLDKSKFMDYLVSRELLYKKALNDDSIDKDELQAIIDLSKMNAAATYYLTEKLKDDIKITDAEIDQFYKQNQNLFKGVPIDDNIISRIRQQLFLQKLEMESNKFVMDLIAESKVNREGFKKHLSKKKKGSSDDDKKDDKDDKEESKE